MKEVKKKASRPVYKFFDSLATFLPTQQISKLLLFTLEISFTSPHCPQRRDALISSSPRMLSLHLFLNVPQCVGCSCIIPCLMWSVAHSPVSIVFLTHVCRTISVCYLVLCIMWTIAWSLWVGCSSLVLQNGTTQQERREMLTTMTREMRVWLTEELKNWRFLVSSISPLLFLSYSLV